MSFWDHVVAAFKLDFFDLDSVEETVRLILRMVTALAVGGLLGWQRERAGKAAGLRTHMLVCLGAALFVAAPQLGGMTTDGLSRIIQGLTTGIGFVGAGAILKTEEPARIHGLTTAAGIWLTAAIGVTVGMGRGATATLVTLLAFLVLWLLPAVERPSENDNALKVPEDAPPTVPSPTPKKRGRKR